MPFFHTSSFARADDDKRKPDTTVTLQNPIQVTINSSFISPLAERFGEISLGQDVFIAGNTVLRADPGTKICIGSKTNMQDNILFLALRNLPAPATRCGEVSSRVKDEVSIAHQAVIRDSSLGNFTFIGFARVWTTWCWATARSYCRARSYPMYVSARI
ncbi:MAG: hypothetical protein M3Q32_01310, partial [Pseudomonadota bacterium]|nr:hypothetical protein [Pseudomonadota bacterium]